MAYVTRTHGARPHAKFQPPAMTGLAVHKGHTKVQNKGNANIYVDSMLCTFESGSLFRFGSTYLISCHFLKPSK